MKHELGPDRANKRVRLHALIHFANDYHSGQWSRGYRILSRAFRAAKRCGMHRPLDYGMVPAAQEIYDHLREDYGNEV